MIIEKETVNAHANRAINKITRSEPTQKPH